MSLPALLYLLPGSGAPIRNVVLGSIARALGMGIIAMILGAIAIVAGCAREKER